MSKKYVGLFLSFVMSMSLQGQIILSPSKLKESYSKIYSIASLDTAVIEYDFITKNDFKNIVSTATIEDIVKVVSLLEIPFPPDSLEKIRVIECYYSTHSFSIWYIILSTKNDNKNYYYMYENNSGVSKIPLMGINENDDYVWRVANMLSENRSEKNRDFMVLAEIQNNSFNILKATQTFHIADDEYFKIVMHSIKESCE